jgi:hypothetical protein
MPLKDKQPRGRSDNNKSVIVIVSNIINSHVIAAVGSNPTKNGSSTQYNVGKGN